MNSHLKKVMFRSITICPAQDATAYIPNVVQWTGCAGTEDHFRGYPCSLWMTFHALTVSAYLQEGEGKLRVILRRQNKMRMVNMSLEFNVDKLNLSTFRS